MRTLRRFLEVAAVFLIACPVYAQQVLITKPYQKWTKQEIFKVASDSPWAQIKFANDMANPTTKEIQLRAVTIRLRSALPIRQVLARQMQLNLQETYHIMNDLQRLDYANSIREMLNCSACADKYIITLSPPQFSRSVNSAIRSLCGLTLDLIKTRVYIANEKGERRELISFSAPYDGTDEAFFFFRRFDESGHPLLTPENKKLIFVFESKDLTTPSGRILVPERFEFDVSQLILAGKVEF